MSSPRQKMVIVAHTQPTELEQRKKRQTLERAKANHLSKQLQMRLQYAKLKVEHGWQRQNLNEVENLYFHHSHQRSMRHGVAQRSHYATSTAAVSYPHGVPVPVETYVQSPAPSGVPDRTTGPSPLANDASSSASISPPSQSPSEHGPSADGRPISHPTTQTPMPLTPASTATNQPPTALDFSDPNVLARLVQLQAQSQQQSQAVSCVPSTTITSTFTPASQPAADPVSIPIPVPGAFQPHFLGMPMSNSVPLYPISATSSQPPVPSSVVTALIPTAPIPTSTAIASSALTYDSFWSTHASSTGPTRALYRTHTGFTASATPGGNVAMLTPGGHAAVMTADGVYVGGGTK